VVCEYELVLQVKIFCLVIGVMEEQRVAIRFCVSAVETIELINKAYGSIAMIRANVYRWYARFRDGREDVKDDARRSSFDCQNRRKRGICLSSADRRPSPMFEYW